MQLANGLPGPDFFILGAPKSGTTSLSTYLGSHPNIFFCPVKEPHFFCDDLPISQYGGDLKAYLALFEGKDVNTQLAGEGSTWYLFSEQAVDNILQYRANAKLIVMLRNPIEMVQSLHSQFVYNMMEDEANFERAWVAHKKQPKDVIMDYEKACKIGQQVERLLRKVPTDQLKIILFEDFKNTPAETHAEVLEFLDVPLVKLESYSAFNKNKQLRSKFLADFLQNTPDPVVQLLNKSKKILGINELGLARAFQTINQKELSREPISAALELELRETFKQDILLLSEILDRDLSHWTN